MKNRIVKSILCLAVTVPLMALADADVIGASDTEGIVPVKESVEDAVPPSAGKQYFSLSESETSTAIDVTTSDYGQLETLLAEKGGNSATAITVTGPIDASDFNAIWECAAKGNLRILNLSRSEIKDNIIPDYALYNTLQFEAGHWLSIRKIILPEEIVKIGKAAFAFMHLEEINIPSSLKELGSTAFGYDRWLDCPIDIPEGVTEIKYQTFIDCLSLSRSPTLPNSLKVIGEHAFANTPFEKIDLNDGLEIIREGAFQSCGITQVKLPNSIIELGPMAFQLCPRLEHISFPDVIEEIPMGLFSMCNALKKVSIPNGVRRIADNAFMLCTNLKDITLPATLESIGKDVFYGCAAEKIVLPCNLKSLGEGSLTIDNLDAVYCASETPPLCEIGQFGPFVEEWISDAVLYVPVGCKEKYQGRWQWNLFKEIIETDFPSSGIACVTIGGKEPDSIIYDLFGLKVSEPRKGNIYIVSGRKVIVK